MPTVQGTDDFNHVIDAGYYTDGFFGTPTQVSTPTYQANPKTLSIVTTGGNVGARHNISGSPTRGWKGVALRLPALPTVGQDISVCGFQSTAVTVGRLHCGSVGLYLSNSSFNGTEFAISIDTWYWVEMIFDVSGNDHNVYGRIGTSDMTSPAAHAAGASSALDFDQLISLGGDTSGITEFYSLWKWGSAASNSDWLGEPTSGGRLGAAQMVGF